MYRVMVSAVAMNPVQVNRCQVPGTQHTLERQAPFKNFLVEFVPLDSPEREASRGICGLLIGIKTRLLVLSKTNCPH